MGFHLKATTAVALVGSALLTYYKQQQEQQQGGLAHPSGWSRSFFVATAAKLWFVEMGLWLVWNIIVYPKLFSPLKHLPTAPNAHWFLGHGGKILKDNPGKPMREWINSVPNEGLIRYFWFFNLERILVVSPKALSEVLVTNNYAFQKPSNVRHSIGRILGYGVLLAEGDEHRRQRRNLNPAFAFRHVKDLYPVFWNKSREVVHAMTIACGSEGSLETFISKWASRVTLDIIGVAGLGRDFHAIQDEHNELVKTYEQIFQPSKEARLLGLAGMIIPAWFLNILPLKRNGDINEAAKAIRSVCRDLIQEKKIKLANKAADVDILSVALESGQFTDEDLVDQLMTFLAAGHETTSTALTWAIYQLCRHPEMQTKLREEIRKNLPSTDEDVQITSVDIDRLPYLNGVCSEVLRSYSPVPVTIREAAHDTTIQGFPVPKGTRVVLAPWANNVDPNLWGADAAEFRPERWIALEEASAEEKKKAASGGASSNYAFMTFLHGPRSCIGDRFARSEFACLLAAWIGRFEFELVDKEEMDEDKLVIKGGVTARPAKGLNVRMRVVGGY